MLTLGFAVLLFASIRLFKNQPNANTNPAIVFSFVGLVVGFGAEAMPFFISTSFQAKSYILSCSIIFIFGAVIGNRAFRPPAYSGTMMSSVSRQSSTGNVVTNTLLVLLGVAFLAGGLHLIMYWNQLVSDSRDISSFFTETRVASVQRGESIFSDFGGLTYFHTGAPVYLFCVSLFLITTGRVSGRWKMLLFPAIACSLLLGMLEGARAGFFYNFISYIVAAYMRGLVGWRGLKLAGFFAIAMFMVTTLVMRESAESWDEGLIVTFNHIVLYFFAPVPLFGQWFDKYGFHLEWFGIYNFLDKIGLVEYEKISKFAPFLSGGIGFDGFNFYGNAYTAFAVVMDNLDEWALIYWLIFGLVAGTAHAWSRWALPLAIYSFMYSSIIQVMYWERFLDNMQIMVRLIIFFTVFKTIESLIDRRFYRIFNRFRQ